MVPQGCHRLREGRSPFCPRGMRKGIATIKKSLAINPDYVQAFYDMAMAQKLGKHYDESIAYFQKVLAADPKNTWSYYGIATNYADKRDKEHALQYL